MDVSQLDLGKRCDFHTHTILSDGEMIASELARRAQATDHLAIAIADHVDKSNIRGLVLGLVEAARDINSFWEVRLLVGVELTHVPYQTIDELARRSKELGANLVIVHGESPVEPVIKGTNAAAAKSRYVDIIAHPGRLTLQDARLAADSGKFAEITAKKGHGKTNGWVVKVATEAGLEMVVNTDLHTPDDFITQEKALEIALESGMSMDAALRSIRDNPLRILEGCELHFRR
jgi:histidinol phosphatase-like PHP family hydrolase